MKRGIWILAIMLGVQFAAYADTPIYQKLECRDDDPFVFCTQGCKNQDKNWTPISPISGTWIAVTGYCPYPTTGACCIGNVCFQPWTQTAVKAVYQYMAICPKAHEQGQWEGQGRPESTPYDH
ncbi:MAG: hypothetical protein ACREO0_15565 [Pseudoxanthomonas sp.]